MRESPTRVWKPYCGDVVTEAALWILGSIYCICSEEPQWPNGYGTGLLNEGSWVSVCLGTQYKRYTFVN